MQRRGFVLLELLAVFCTVLLLAILILSLLAAARHRTRVVVAKGQISSLAKAIEDVKNDTGYYPVFLSDILSETPPFLMDYGWAGPYAATLTQDPWRNPYYYRVPPTTLLDTGPLPRTTGQPVTLAFPFAAPPGADLLIRVENYGVTSARLWLNGTELFPPNTFRNNPRPQILECELPSLAANNFIAWAASTPGDNFTVGISAMIPTPEYFILGSYGADGENTGEGEGADIEWHSKAYPHFQ